MRTGFEAICILMLVCFGLWRFVPLIPPPSDDSTSEAVAVELPGSCVVAQEENEDIEDDSPQSYQETNCAPHWYKPPEYLVPDKFHPAQTLKNLKP